MSLLLSCLFLDCASSYLRQMQRHNCSFAFFILSCLIFLSFPIKILRAQEQEMLAGS
jgi:hypothetical protein